MRTNESVCTSVASVHAFDCCMQKYALDTTTLLVIELAVWAVFEYKRYGNIKKYGQVRTRHLPSTANATLHIVLHARRSARHTLPVCTCQFTLVHVQGECVLWTHACMS